ncbi:transmembrane protein, putative (macronuclear) [Tetrahymena thermophila SB210]|uniref:Transmembrane protein, putative n=1 Tax=Tetrahymena thermophila (strain SB210) TaxID=312017 RepID=W7X2M9_TETTS|nr:transmembrane protein, putative [Tetrahymena thermophila SB210]EWS73520.1 transmembrane protein, putative [Tetrahymena thermophila SB210]|eukprot:XP_012653945.1 transmembrane protein, putative [Tetrahymena thermophila SB210]
MLCINKFQKPQKTNNLVKGQLNQIRIKIGVNELIYQTVEIGNKRYILMNIIICYTIVNIILNYYIILVKSIFYYINCKQIICNCEFFLSILYSKQFLN